MIYVALSHIAGTSPDPEDTSEDTNAARPRRSSASRSPKWESRERITCPECGRDVAGYVPRHGDGTGLFPVMHKNAGESCAGRFQLVFP